MDSISDEDLALIAAFPKRKVTKVPAGASGLPEIMWNPDRNRILYVDPDEGEKARRKSARFGRTAATKAKEEQGRANRAQIRKLYDPDINRAENVKRIAKEMKVSTHTVTRGLTAMGIKGERKRISQEKIDAIHQEARKGSSTADIARAAGVSQETARRYKNRMPA